MVPHARTPDTCRASVAGRVAPDRRLNDALDGAGCVLFAVPSHGLRAVVRDAAPGSRPDAVLVSATKGLETESLRRMSQVIAEETGTAGRSWCFGSDLRG